jgi:hypothetical protein
MKKIALSILIGFALNPAIGYSLTVSGTDTENVYSGDSIAWLYANDNSEVNITYVDDLSWLLVNDDSQVNIFGSNFNYSNGHLSGVWANGLSFSFWALEETDLQNGSIGSIIPDNIRLRAVPIPATVWLFGSGLALLGWMKRRPKQHIKLGR